jgi:HAE1 family hydrophobic/amphiphilic exporter-1
MSAAAKVQQAFSASLFVRRPILAFVLNALIVVAGLAAFKGIEVRELPSVDRPVVTVRTLLDGASPETIDREVTDVIEGAVARVTGLKTVSSKSLFGSSRVTLEFSDTTDLATAAADVRDALSRVTNNLPDNIDAPQIIKADADSQPVMRLAVTSSTMRSEDLTVYIEDNIESRLAAVDGVADVQYFGDKKKAFRIDINQAKLASRGLTVADLKTALSTAALDVPAGSIENPQTNIVVRATSDLTTP